MCGVIGLVLRDVDESKVELVRELFRQSQIRGKHATGVTYIKEGRLVTIKEPIPARNFVEVYDFNEFVDNDSIFLIGHIRYSTSDLKFNQPFTNSEMSIAHNGVLSQEPRESWDFKTETGNDSEMILRCFESGYHPLQVFKRKSMAVCTLERNGNLSGFRNHERPLWYTTIDDGIVFTSTKDIAIRSGLKSPQKCEMFTHYLFSNGALSSEKYKHEFDDLQ